jgi:hypothetical protein
MGIETAIIGAAIAGAATTTYGAIQQRNAGNRAEASQRQALQKQEKIQAEQKKKSDQEAMLLSDEIRRKKSARGRRSLLQGGEEGVDDQGLRRTTG